MKSCFIAVPLALALAASACAQTPAPVTPATPAPVVTDLAPAPTPNKIVYLPRLPSADELTSAAAQHTPIVKIEVTPTQVTAVYQAANTPATTVIYRLLQPTGSEAPAVVYQPAPTVVYYDDYYHGPRYYGPGYWYPPVSLRVGFGYGYRHAHFGHRR